MKLLLWLEATKFSKCPSAYRMWSAASASVTGAVPEGLALPTPRPGEAVH